MERIKNIEIIGAEKRTTLFDIHFIKNNIKKPIIIYIHGFNGFKDWGNFDLIAEKFASQNYFFVKMNLSHNGTTTSQPEEFADLEAYSKNNYSKELLDVEKMIEWFFEAGNTYQNEFEINQIILLGHSRGGGISILKAKENIKVNAIITWASVAECKTPWGNWDIDKIKQWEENGIVYIENKRTHQQLPIRYQLYQDFVNNKEKYNIQKALSCLTIPILLCHGTLDESVPFSAFEKLKKSNKNAAVFVVESNHVFGRSHPNTEHKIPEVCLEVINNNIHFLKNNGL